MRICNECNDKKMCNKCNLQIIENKEFKANLNEIKRHPPNEFGFLLPYYKKNSFEKIVIFKNMIEDLIENFIEEIQKYNMKGLCVLGSCLINQNVPHSKINKGFLIRKNKYYCLHVWIEYENEIYDIGNMYNIRTMPMLYVLGPPQYTIEKPINLENKADDYKEFPLQLTNFNPMTYYKNAPQHVKKCVKSNNRKVMKKKIFLDSGIVKPILI